MVRFNGMIISLSCRLLGTKFTPRIMLKLTFVFLIVICTIYVITAVKLSEQCEKNADGVGCEGDEQDNDALTNRWSAEIHLSVVACGDRLNETLVMIKSAILFTRAPLHVHIFADDDLRPLFQQQLESWPSDVSKKFKFTLYPIQFPDNVNSNDWRKLFKPCASQRLFIPDILVDVNALLYVDTDVLFLRPLDDIWQFFSEFNATQIAALAPEHEEPSASWYARFARHPYVPPYGLNSGVMLMSLTRMREVNWTIQMVEYYKKYRYDITWGDQDLINVFFHFFPDKLFQYECKWNYRPDHCMYMSNCKSAVSDGVSVVHGCRSSFHNEKQPIFKAIYQAVRDHTFGESLEALLVNIKQNMQSAERSSCGQVSNIFTKQLETYINQQQTIKP